MNIYVETNFVLEIALLQEQREDCEQILVLCAMIGARLVVPGYCLVEPYETLIRRQRKRVEIQKQLETELRQIARTETNKEALHEFGRVTNLLTSSAQEDSIRFDTVRGRILRIADVIPLDAEVLKKAETYPEKHGMSPQDSIVYASVLSDLDRCRSSRSFFISRDGDFDDQDIVEELEGYNCRFIPDFGGACQVIEHDLS